MQPRAFDRGIPFEERRSRAAMLPLSERLVEAPLVDVLAFLEEGLPELGEKAQGDLGRQEQFRKRVAPQRRTTFRRPDDGYLRGRGRGSARDDPARHEGRTLGGAAPAGALTPDRVKGPDVTSSEAQVRVTSGMTCTAALLDERVSAGAERTKGRPTNTASSFMPPGRRGFAPLLFAR
ncbi:MAG: hypothetical protein KDG89_10010 [Geminicoccaceae bacterium]|nr:hypothetical protein [Geminicoccaceae bacterium]